MNINHLHLHVRDVEKSRAFYEPLLGMSERLNHGGVLFLSNEAGFDLALAPDDEPAAMPAWFHFGCKLANAEDVDAAYARALEHDAPIVAPIEIYDDFVFFRLKDPDGYQIEVYWE